MLLFPSLLLDSKNNNPSPQYSTKTYPLTNNAWRICYTILSFKEDSLPALSPSHQFQLNQQEESAHDVVVSSICAG